MLNRMLWRDLWHLRGQIMAAALVCVIPVVVLFFFCQKYILTGFSKAAMK